MSLMFGVTAAADVGGEPPPVVPSQAFALTAGYRDRGGFYDHGYARGAIGSIQPDELIKGVSKNDILHISSGDGSSLLVTLAATALALNFIDKVSITGSFQDGGAARTVDYLTTNAALQSGVDWTTWDWVVVPISDFMIPGNIYDVVIEWAP